MRWTRPTFLEERTSRFFAIFPAFDLKGNWRWLEWVTARFRWHDGWEIVEFLD